MLIYNKAKMQHYDAEIFTHQTEFFENNFSREITIVKNFFN